MVALDVCLYILSALCGLVVGSFLNVCIYRLPRGEFFSKSRSFCPNCKAPIKAYDNIPVLSYIILRGKCRNCGQRISPRYPLVELLTCALWVGNYAAFGVDGMTIVYDITVAVLIVAAFVDLDTFEIPDSGIITLLVLGAVTFAPFGGVSWQDKLIGCVCVSVPMLIVCLFGGMGFGDVKLYFVLGLLLGWQKILVVFLLSVVSGAVVSVAYLLVKRRKGDCDGECAEELPEGESGKTPSDETSGAVAEDKAEAAEGEELGGKAAGAQSVAAVTDGASEDSDIVGGSADDAEAAHVAPVVPFVSEEEREKAVPAEEGSASEDGEGCVGSPREGASEDADDSDDPLPMSKRGKVIPFGPFIALATVVTLYGGDALISIYARLLGL